MEKMLVTGGAGFIGSRLTDALIVRRINICVFDNLSGGTLQNIKNGLTTKLYLHTRRFAKGF